MSDDVADIFTHHFSVVLRKKFYPYWIKSGLNNGIFEKLAAKTFEVVDSGRKCKIKRNQNFKLGSVL